MASKKTASNDSRHWAAKHRPTSLQNMVLSSSIKERIKRHIEHRDRSTFLISGGTGIGKTSLARILAFGCARIPYTGTSEDDEARGSITEINAASSRAIDDMRSLVASTRFLPPKLDGRRVVIIDEFHALTGPAAAALLKPLEEPNEHTIWILVTNEPSKILPTIRNRCTTIHIQNLSLDDLQRRLLDILRQENVLQKWSRADQLQLVEACLAAADEVPRAAIQLLQDAATSSGQLDVNSMIVALVDRSTALEAREGASLILLSLLAAGEGHDAIQAMIATVVAQDSNVLLDQLHVVTNALIVQAATGQKQSAAYTFNGLNNDKLQTVDLKHLGLILQHLVRARASIVGDFTDARGPLVNALLCAQRGVRRVAAKRVASKNSANHRDKAA